MSTNTNPGDPSQVAIDRICDSLDNAGVAGKGTSAALRAMRSHWVGDDGVVNPNVATDNIEAAIGLLEKVRKALFKQSEHAGPIKLVPIKLGQSVILSESSILPLGTIRVSDMNFGVPRTPETDKITVTILKGKPGTYKRVAMEILEGRTGLIEWHEKNIGPIEGGVDMPIQELLEFVSASMYRQATAS